MDSSDCKRRIKKDDDNEDEKDLHVKSDDQEVVHVGAEEEENETGHNEQLVTRQKIKLAARQRSE